ncbi:Hepatic lectin [Varanus komodoensis]|nr:Hepatic lectin [Varanus komodoensis]
MGLVGTYKRQHNSDEASLAETRAAVAPKAIDRYILPLWKEKSSLLVYLLLAVSYLLILILFGITLSMVYPCGSRSREWEYYDGGCYYFGIQKVNWHAAQSHCEEQNSKLVVIHDEPKQNFIQSQTRDERYWIGLSDVNVEGEWKWIDGTDYRTSYKKWRSGEPNVHGDHGEDCAQIHIAGEWNDVQCNYKSFYICEKPLPS